MKNTLIVSVFIVMASLLGCNLGDKDCKESILSAEHNAKCDNPNAKIEFMPQGSASVAICRCPPVPVPSASASAAP
jgi:hypothetical protein